MSLGVWLDEGMNLWTDGWMIEGWKGEWIILSWSRWMKR